MDPELVWCPRTLVGLRLNVDMPNAGGARVPVGLEVRIPVQHPKEEEGVNIQGGACLYLYEASCA